MSIIFHASGPLDPDDPTNVMRESDHEVFRVALEGEFVHIFHPRQMGKSTLLQKLDRRLRDERWRCCYIDLSTLADFTKPYWYEKLGNILADELTPGDRPELANQLDLKSYLLDKVIPWTPGHPYVALLLDEVESIFSARDGNGRTFSNTFFSTLRTLYRRKHIHDGKLTIVFAGATNPADLVKDEHISPFNVGRKIEHLGDLTKDDVKWLVGKLTTLGIFVDDRVHEVIYAWTSGHPYLTQRICSELEKPECRKSPMVVTADDVMLAVEKVFLKPVDTLNWDSNIEHVNKMLSNLSGVTRTLWQRVRNREIISVQETDHEDCLHLRLTGVIRIQNGHLLFHNRIYETLFPKELPQIEGLPHTTNPTKSTEKARMCKLGETFLDYNERGRVKIIIKTLIEGRTEQGKKEFFKRCGVSAKIVEEYDQIDIIKLEELIYKVEMQGWLKRSGNHTFGMFLKGVIEELHTNAIGGDAQDELLEILDRYKIVNQATFNSIRQLLEDR